MRIWPAIDLKNGNCVRLSQGDFHKETVYGSDPADMASRWVSEGANGLHVIDLDGAMGLPPNRKAIQQISDQVDIDIQFGGGVRTQATIEEYLSIGIKRIIIASKAVEDTVWIEQMANRYEGHLVISIDARDGRVAHDGWRKLSNTSVIDHAKTMSRLPIAGLIYTNIDTAGMLSGPDTKTIQHIQRNTNVPLIASGGIATLEDIELLSKLTVEGCIVGRAIYEGRLTLPETISSVALKA